MQLRKQSGGGGTAQQEEGGVPGQVLDVPGLVMRLAPPLPPHLLAVQALRGGARHLGGELK